MKKWVLWATTKSVHKAPIWLRSYTRIMLVSILVLQIGVAPALAQPEYAPREVKPPDPIEALKNNPVYADFYQDPHNREYSRKFLSFNEAYSQDKLPPSQTNYDPMKLANQRVELIRNGEVYKTYSLNDYSVEPIDAGHSSLRIRYSPETRELFFEGVVGAKTDGTAGEVVVRHVIPNMDLASYAKDLEMLSMIDSKGQLHAIDMGFAIEQLFKSPVPVISNLWKASDEFLEKYKPNLYRLQYHYRALAPYSEDQLTEFSIIPQNANGQTLLQAGDVYITFNDFQGNEKVLGFFPRQVIHKRFEEAATILLAQATLVKPKKEFLEFLAQKLVGSEQTPELLEMNPLLRNYLTNLDLSQLKTLKHRIESNETSIQRQYDQYTLDQLIQDAEFLNQQHQRAQEDAKEKGQAFEIALRDSFQSYINQAPRENPFPKKETIMSRMLKRTDTESFRRVAAILAFSGGAAYLAFPFLMDLGLNGIEIQALGWIYENAYSDIMQTAYKYPLAISMFSLLMLAPLMISASVLVQSLLKSLNAYASHHTTWWAHKIRDVFKNWNQLSKWEFMGSLGLRQVFVLSYPPMLALFKYIFQQRAFLSAVEHGVNPFKLIRPESDLGRALGITKPERVGMMSLSLPPGNAASARDAIQKMKDLIKEKHDRKIEIQSALVVQKRRATQLAMILSTVIISEKYQVDPATLVGLMSGDMDIEHLYTIHKDPKKFQNWTVLTEEITRNILSENSSLLINQDIPEVDPKELLAFAQLAIEKATMLQQMPQLRQTLKFLYIGARDIGEKIVNNVPFVNLGRERLSHLKSLYVNRFIAEQGRREFWTDFPVSVILYGMIGGRADSSDPKNLSAGTTMHIGDTEVALPWYYFMTNPMHMYDMFYTAFAGLFTSFARMTLVFQEMQKSQPERTYTPKEYIELKSDERKQGIWSAFWDWTKGVADFENSDLGGVFMKSYTARIATMQAGLVMTTLLRLIFVPVAPEVSFMQNLYMASAGFFLYMFWAQWQYGYIDDIVRRGNDLFFKRFGNLNHKLDQAKLKLHRGLSEPDSQEALKILREGYSEMIDLYESQNRQALNFILKSYNKESQEIKMAHELPSKVTSQERAYYGLILEATLALRENNTHRFQTATQALKQALKSEHNLDDLDLERLNARSILMLSLSNPPVYTQENKLFFWVVQVSSLIIGTYLSIDLSIMIFSPERLAPFSLAYTVLLSATLIPVALLLTGKTAWTYYNRVFRHIKNRMRSGLNNLKATLLPEAKASISSCESFFK